MTTREVAFKEAVGFIDQNVLPAIGHDSRLLVTPEEYGHRVKYHGRQVASPAELIPRIGKRIETEQEISLYAHMPICRYRCNYCHYPVIASRNDAKVGGWVDALTQESALLLGEIPVIGQRAVSSLYIGGGTPTLMSPDELSKLVGMFRAHYGVAETTEITIEGTPETYTPEKIQALQSLGVNRVSVGVQILDPELLALNNRRHTPELSLEAINRLVEAEFPQVNVDLIYGFPGQTLEKFYDDIETMIGLNPTSVTIYRLRLGRSDELPTVLHKQYERHPEQFPAPSTPYAMQYMARRLLESSGYREGPSGWFSRLPIEVYQDRWVNQTALVGLGWHSYSYSREYEYYNQDKPLTYLQALREGRVPIQQGSIYTEEEQVERWVFFRLKSVFAVSLRDFTARFGGELLSHSAWATFFSRLAELRLAIIGNDTITLTPAGKVLVEEIIR